MNKRESEIAQQGELLGLKSHLAFVEDLLEGVDLEGVTDGRSWALLQRAINSRDETQKKIERIEGDNRCH